MKTINYTGSSKLISRIVHLLNRKAPLPLDGDGDAVWGTNGQVLTTDGNGNTSWTTPQGGGGDVADVEVNGTSVVDAQGVANVTVPTNTSDLNNDSGFITNLVNDLANYYTKSQTYTQAEVNALISGIVTLNILVVQTLPTQDISTTTIYLVPKQDAGTDDIYDEYLYINNAWELIGTTQIDLSNYVTTTDLSTALADYVTSVGLATILDDYVQSSDLGNGTLTIQQNGTTLGTFSANQSGNTTVNLTGGGSTYTEGDGIDISAQDVISVDTTFTEASTRANIASGDSLATIWGKIKKFFTDLKTVAFTGAYSDLSGTENVAKKNVNNRFSANQTIDDASGTTSTEGYTGLTLGNNKPSGTDGNTRGILQIFGKGAYSAGLRASNMTANRNIELPDASGTIALTSDLNATVLDMSGITNGTGVNRFTYTDFRAEKLGNMVHVCGTIIVSSGTAYGDESNIVDFINNLPFTAAENVIRPAQAKTIGLIGSNVVYGYIRFTSNKIQLAFTQIAANTAGRLNFDTCLRVN